MATSMSNLGLERALAREGISLARAAVGDRYVLEEMLKSDNNLGGEQSGHIIFLDDSPAGDGLLTAVKVASLVSMKGSLESLVEGLKDYPQIIVNVKVKAKPPLESIARSGTGAGRGECDVGRKWPGGVALFRYGASGASDGGGGAPSGRRAVLAIDCECTKGNDWGVRWSRTE